MQIVDLPDSTFQLLGEAEEQQQTLPLDTESESSTQVEPLGTSTPVFKDLLPPTIRDSTPVLPTETMQPVELWLLKTANTRLLYTFSGSQELLKDKQLKQDLG